MLIVSYWFHGLTFCHLFHDSFHSDFCYIIDTSLKCVVFPVAVAPSDAALEAGRLHLMHRAATCLAIEQFPWVSVMD